MDELTEQDKREQNNCDPMDMIIAPLPSGVFFVTRGEVCRTSPAVPPKMHRVYGEGEPLMMEWPKA